MKYFEVTFTTSPCNETVNDIVSALAGEIGFESFVEWEGGVQAYIQQQLFDEEALKEMIANFPLPDTSITYIIKEAEDKDWNEEWEKNFFQPIVIGDRCCIHSTFHKDTPQTEYEILITTKRPVPSSASCSMPTCKGNPYSTWVVALPSLLSWLPCVAPILSLQSTSTTGV